MRFLFRLYSFLFTWRCTRVGPPSVVSSALMHQLVCVVCVVLMSGHIQMTASRNGVQSVSSSVGQSAVLSCSCGSGIEDVTEVAVEWTRTDLVRSYVLFFRDGRLDPTRQDPSFENRVELADPELKQGNLSMVLKDVQRHDNGTYECHFLGPPARKRRAIISDTPLTTVQLTITDHQGPGDGGLSHRHRLALVGPLLTFLGLGAVFNFLYFRKSSAREESV